MSLEKDIERARQLLNKTVANGCTEGEATSAKKIAIKILAKHNLTIEDVASESPWRRSHTSRPTSQSRSGVASFSCPNCGSGYRCHPPANLSGVAVMSFTCQVCRTSFRVRIGNKSYDDSYSPIGDIFQDAYRAQRQHIENARRELEKQKQRVYEEMRRAREALERDREARQQAYQERQRAYRERTRKREREYWERTQNAYQKAFKDINEAREAQEDKKPAVSEAETKAKLEKVRSEIARRQRNVILMIIFCWMILLTIFGIGVII